MFLALIFPLAAALRPLRQSRTERWHAWRCSSSPSPSRCRCPDRARSPWASPSSRCGSPGPHRAEDPHRAAQRGSSSSCMRFAIPGLLGTIRYLFLHMFEDDSYEGRRQDYSVVGRFIKERPLFGRGFGTFLPERYVYLDNQYLGLLIELGIVGMLAFFVILLFVGIVHRSGRPSACRRRDPLPRPGARRLDPRRCRDRSHLRPPRVRHRLRAAVPHHRLCRSAVAGVRPRSRRGCGARDRGPGARTPSSPHRDRPADRDDRAPDLQRRAVPRGDPRVPRHAGAR